MVKYAKLDSNNKVTDVIVLDDIYEDEAAGKSFIKDECKIEGNWIKSSSERKNQAAIGTTYNATLDAFISDQPYPSWTLDPETARWKAPVEQPIVNAMHYIWSEEELNWVEILPS